MAVKISLMYAHTWGFRFRYKYLYQVWRPYKRVSFLNVWEWHNKKIDIFCNRFKKKFVHLFLICLFISLSIIKYFGDRWTIYLKRLQQIQRKERRLCKGLDTINTNDHTAATAALLLCSYTKWRDGKERIVEYKNATLRFK